MIFIIGAALIFVVVDELHLSTWLSTCISILAYFQILGRMAFIAVTANRLEIFYFNLFGGYISIPLHNARKLSTHQSYEIETAPDIASTYQYFVTVYNLEFIDGKGKKKNNNL